MVTRVMTLVFLSLLATAALAEQRQGTSWFDLSIASDGSLVAVEAVDEFPAALDEALRNWIRQQEFQPARLDGQAVPSKESLWLQFELRDSDEGVALKVIDSAVKPRRIAGKPPRYPMQRQHENGRVEAAFTVMASGAVADVEILSSSSEHFAKSVREALQDWRFKPREVDGRAVPVSAKQTFNFNSPGRDYKQHPSSLGARSEQ